MIKRQISKQILKYFKQYPVISLTGPRQSGKTTLVKNIFPKMDYFNLEDIETRDFAMRDPKSFLGNHPNGLIIDEAQRVPELMSQIQVIVDEKKVPGQFILTGSQNFLLMEKISQSLAGRAAILNLLPFSLLELEEANINLSGKLE
ncbi:AAA family ATPase, partial [Candidatus Kuenenbacteria bacterium CG08_land_8_20_14_0_20_37_23]